MISRKEDLIVKKTSPFFYCLGQGLKSISRNKAFSLAAIATVAACVFMIGVFLAAIFNMNHIVRQAEESVFQQIQNI
jgi:cell division transport system permease protein